MSTPKPPSDDGAGADRNLQAARLALVALQLLRAVAKLLSWDDDRPWWWPWD